MDLQNEVKTDVKISFKKKLIEKGIIRKLSVFTFFLFVFSLTVYILSILSTDFAEFWSRYPSQGLRMALAFFSNLAPFSLAEMLIFLIPLIVTVYFYCSFRAINNKSNENEFYRFLVPLVCFVFVLLSYFFLAFGPCYYRNPIDKNLGLEKNKVSAEELQETYIKLCGEVNEIIAEVGFGVDNSSHMPYSYNELVDKINEAFASFSAKYDFISHIATNPKPVLLSEPMSYTHILGVYSFFTGEANINVNFPDYHIPFTIAHEMAHQRGIAREDEANLIAFLVCSESDDAYVKYSAYSSVLIGYMNSAFNKADPEMYAAARKAHYSQKLVNESAAYSLFFDKYRTNTVSNVVGKINDTYLQSQGQKEGTNSYNLVVDLLVAYYKFK